MEHLMLVLLVKKMSFVFIDFKLKHLLNAFMMLKCNCLVLF